MFNRDRLKIRLIKISIGIFLTYFVVIGIGQHPVDTDDSPGWNFTENSFRETIIPGKSDFSDVMPTIVASHERGFNSYQIITSIRDDEMNNAPPNFHLENFISRDENALFDEILEGCPIERRVDSFEKKELCTFSQQQAWKNLPRFLPSLDYRPHKHTAMARTKKQCQVVRWLRGKFV